VNLTLLPSPFLSQIAGQSVGKQSAVIFLFIFQYPFLLSATLQAAT
jgi:ABC-type methionine transport system permease subunit